MGGALAAGMAVKMEVSFYPDTLQDSTDYLTVESEGFTVKIPVEARRDPPQLNLPPTIDIGEILFSMTIFKQIIVVIKVVKLNLNCFWYLNSLR